jgi:hypothetical protein
VLFWFWFILLDFGRGFSVLRGEREVVGEWNVKNFEIVMIDWGCD